MQNFTECARRHTISKKLLKPVLRCNTGRQSDLNRMFMNTGARTCVRRLLVPVPIHTYQAVCKDQSVIKALRPTFIQHHSSLGLPGLYRFFNTTALFCAHRQAKKDFDKKPEENKDQSDKDKKSDKDDKNKHNKKYEVALPVLIHLTMLTCTGILLYYVMNGLSDAERMEIVHTTSWNEFVHQMLMKGEVQKIIINVDSNVVKIVLQNNAVVNNKKATFKIMYLVVPDLAKTEERIREAEDKLGIPYHERVPIVFERTLEHQRHITNTIYGLGMLFLILGIASKSKNIMKDINILKPFFPKYTVTEPTTGKGIRFSDVAGLKEAKVEVMEFVDYLQQPERYRTLGAKMPKGVLLLGPPGCGKTMLAKAVATESNVPFLSMNGCEFIEMYGGLGAARVRDLFKEAKRRAPCIIYIDEIDAVGQVRATNSQNGNNESERTLVQLLVEMDGMGTQEDIVILASTNRPEVLDKALLRRGRFDRHILIDLPTQLERKEIFEKHLGTLSLEKPPPDYSEYLAAVTPGFTGADIANVCNEAALHAARFEKTKISGQDLMYAIERARNGPAKITNAMSDMERKIVAYREAGYALLTWLLKNTDPVAKVTIVPTTSGSLGHTQILEGLSYIVPVSKIEDLTCATLGSRITETLVFGYSTDGTKHYLKTVTDLVTKQVAQYGLSPAVGLLGFEPDKYKKEGRPFSKKLDSIIDAEVRRIILEASNRAEKLLLKNRRLLNALAEELLKKDTLYYEDIEKLIGAPPYPKKRPQIPAGFMENTATAINQKY